jgi:hypothetical protein
VKRVGNGWQLRGASLGLAIALHIGLALWVASPRSPPHHTSPVEPTDGLEVRFVAAIAAAKKRSDGGRARLEVNPKLDVRMRKSAVDRPALAAPPVPRTLLGTDAAPSPPVAERQRDEQANVRFGGSDYVAGGALFQAVGNAGNGRVRLPGGSRQANAPRFHMVDPRSQGIAGAVRLIGSLTGAVDKHCVDLDAWRGMTPEEKIAHHVSEADMARARDSYGCDAPPSRARARDPMTIVR